MAKYADLEALRRFKTNIETSETTTKIKVGDNTVTSTINGNGVTFEGSGVTIAADTANNKVTFTVPAAEEYSIAETTTTEGALKTYGLKKGNNFVADSIIDIPKDFLVKSATSGVVTTADKEAGGKFENNDSYQVGDAYLDFVINVKEGTGTDEHVYVNVSNLVDVYTNGDGLNLNNNEFSVKIDNTNANGLSVDTNGIALATATTTTAGAMSAADKTTLNKLNDQTFTASNTGVEVVTDSTTKNVTIGAKINTNSGLNIDTNGLEVVAGNGVTVDANGVGVQIDSTNANGLSVGANGVSLATVTASTNGAMLATDKEKLDNLETTYATTLTAETNGASVDLKLKDGQTTASTRSTVNIKTGQGATVTIDNTSVQIGIDAGNGIALDAEGINAVGYDGIIVNASGISADINTTAGLEFTGATAGSKQIGIKLKEETNEGTTTNVSGLAFDNGALYVNTLSNAEIDSLWNSQQSGS